MKIATWNVNSLRVRLPHLAQWLAANPVDVLAIQETKVVDAEFPFAEIAALGYQCVASGQKIYNGVVILARKEHSEVAPDIPGFDDDHKRVLASTGLVERCVSCEIDRTPRSLGRVRGPGRSLSARGFRSLNASRKWPVRVMYLDTTVDITGNASQK